METKNFMVKVKMDVGGKENSFPLQASSIEEARGVAEKLAGRDGIVIECKDVSCIKIEPCDVCKRGGSGAYCFHNPKAGFHNARF